MGDFYVLKRESMYYADGDFTQDEKSFADKLRLGQAKNIKRKFDRFRYADSSLPEVEIIHSDKDGE